MQASISTTLSAPPRPARICSALLLIWCSSRCGVESAELGLGDLVEAARVVGVEAQAQGHLLDHHLRRHDRGDGLDGLGQVGPGEVQVAALGERRRAADAEHRARRGRGGRRRARPSARPAGRGRQPTSTASTPSLDHRDRAVAQVGVGVAAHRPQARLLHLERGLERGAEEQPAAGDDDAVGRGAAPRRRRTTSVARRRGDGVGHAVEVVGEAGVRAERVGQHGRARPAG